MLMISTHRKKFTYPFNNYFCFKYTPAMTLMSLIIMERSTFVNPKHNDVPTNPSENTQLPGSCGTSVSCRMQVSEGSGEILNKLIFFLATNPQHFQVSLTRQVPQPKFPESKVPILPVVKENGQSISLLVELGPTNDAQVLQGQVFKLVQSHQHIACDFSDRLEGRNYTNTSDMVHF